MTKLAILRTAGLSALALAAVACGPSAEDVWTSDEGLLRYVPADTPYVLAKVGPPPDDVADRFESSLDTMLGVYRQIIRNAAAREADAPSRAEALEAVADLLTVDALHEAGLTRDSTMVLYGAGLLPVLRFTLSEGHAFEDAVGRIESAAGRELGAAALDGQAYRYLDLAEARFVMRLDGREAAFSLVPSGLSEDQLRSVLGLSLPGESLADSRALRELADGYGFLPYYVGFLDVDRIAATFLEDPSGINAELLELADYDAASLSDTCRAELRAVANVVPRALFGYTALSLDELGTNTVFELREDIATGLAGVAAPVPALGLSHDALLAYGMGFDLSAAREFYRSRIDAVEADPFECELFADMQNGLIASRRTLDGAPPFAYDFKGFLAIVDDVGELGVTSGRVPTSVDARVVIAADNAPSLIAMAALFSPDIAALDLQPNGEPVRVEVPRQAGVPIEVAYVALTENTIALAVGDDAETRLTAMQNAPSSERSTFLSFEMDMGRYYELLGDSLSQGGLGARNLPELDVPVNESVRQLLESFESRSRVDVRFTERGIEAPATITLAE